MLAPVSRDSDSIVIENLSEVHDVLGIEEEVKASQALTVGFTVPLAVLADAVLTFVVDEDEVAGTHFLVCFACL
jgi:hypothetical protein